MVCLSPVKFVRSHLAKVLLASMLLVVSVWASVAPRATARAEPIPIVDTFLWRFDTSEGIVVTYKLRAQDFSRSMWPKTVRVTVKQKGNFPGHWDIRQTNAYFRQDGIRRTAISEGPFPLPSHENKHGETVQTWVLHDLERSEYEIDFMLHISKDGMSFDDVREAIMEGDRWKFSVEPLDDQQAHERTVS